jgi:oxygen-independent coproporphyrinogen-3 oxidase
MAGVYISWPFCSQKCTYCNFASGVFPPELERQYGTKLIAEIQSTPWPWTPETVYLGGGTPSLIPAHVLQSILDAIPGRPWVEATIEAAPGSFSVERVDAWVDSGIDRVSLGVQSFVDAELRRTGRKHTAEIVERDLRTLRGAGIENCNLDLIAGLAGQTAASWELSLDQIEQLAPPHVSVYMLDVDEDSRLGLEILNQGPRYGARDVPSEALTVEMYERAVQRLQAMGLRRYEFSNFARPGFESRHNLKYWKLEPYLGFGVDAHSFDGNTRWSNVDSAAAYVEREDPRAESVKADAAGEPFLVGLRLSEGIAMNDSMRVKHDGRIRRFVEEGLLEETAGRLRLTSRGILLSNDVIQEFLSE